MYHVRDDITQFLYKFWGLQSQHFSRAGLPAVPITTSGKKPASTQLSSCYGAGGFTDVSPRVEMTSSLWPVDSPDRDSVMGLPWEAANFEWHFVIEVAVSTFFSLL